jgi:hypothetical protein
MDLMRSFLGILAFALLACGSDPTSKYPRQLGAPCETAADCDKGALCTRQIGQQSTLPFCYLPCGSDDAPCPPGAFCSDVYTNLGMPKLCVRTCADVAFCRDLHPGTNSCRTWSGTDPAAPKSCGFKG